MPTRVFERRRDTWQPKTVLDTKASRKKDNKRRCGGHRSLVGTKRRQAKWSISSSKRAAPAKALLRKRRVRNTPVEWATLRG